MSPHLKSLPKEADDLFETSIFKVNSGNGVHYSTELLLLCVEVPFDSQPCFLLEFLLDRIPGSALSLVAADALIIQGTYLRATLDKIRDTEKQRKEKVCSKYFYI